jgi:hypothetical protein
VEQFPPEQLAQALFPLVVMALEEGLPRTMGPPVLNLQADINF